MQSRAETVIVGAGIVGATAAYHLAELGVTDVLVLDQGPLFETGGSTSHAPGLVFQTNGSRTMCRIAQDTVALYDDLDLDGEPGWYGVGGLEVATTPERVEELKRRLGFARSYGIEGTELLTPAEAAERIPLLNPGHILGAYHVPSDGIAKAVRIVTALARKAEAKGVAFEGGVTVTGFDTTGRARPRGRDRRGAGSSASASCSAPGSGGRRSARWPACRSRSSPSSTSSSGPTRCPSWRGSPARRSCIRSCATRTCRCTSGTAATTTPSATTGTSRS